MKVSRRTFGAFLLASGLAALAGRVAGAGAAPDSAAAPGKKSVGVLLYDGALVLDFGIAAEMFAAADFQKEYDVWTFSTNGEPVRPHLVGEVRPSYAIANAPPADVLILPGGMNWPRMAADETLQEFLKARHGGGTILFAVCTGVFILAKNGYLDGRRAITNYQGLPLFRQAAPQAIVAEGERFVDLGDIVTTAGSGTAMDATLNVIERLSGKPIADDLAKRYLDYPYWQG
jgi:transcriptional regulator GlxA family with amidase domain